MIFVISRSKNSYAREAVRRTWGNLKHLKSVQAYAHLRLELIFLLDIDQFYLVNIKYEQQVFGDLVQVHLPEQYSLSSQRDMAILHWTETFCSQALVTIKTDDDVFTNIFTLASVLVHILSTMNRNSQNNSCLEVKDKDSTAIIYGVKIETAKAVRSVNDPTSGISRYVVTDDEYPCRYYPDYMSGFGYMINQRARVKLLCVFFRDEKPFPLSDVYITGFLADYAGVVREELLLEVNSRESGDCFELFNLKNSYACASPSHHKLGSTVDNDRFQKFNSYWKQINRARSYYSLIHRVPFRQLINISRL